MVETRSVDSAESPRLVETSLADSEESRRLVETRSVDSSDIPFGGCGGLKRLAGGATCSMVDGPGAGERQQIPACALRCETHRQPLRLAGRLQKPSRQDPQGAAWRRSEVLSALV